MMISFGTWHEFRYRTDRIRQSRRRVEIAFGRHAYSLPAGFWRDDKDFIGFGDFGDDDFLGGLVCGF